MHTLFDKANLPIEKHYRLCVRASGDVQHGDRQLMKRNLSDENIYSTLERHMKCGVKCQHCAVGRTLVCTDGPVYTYRQIKTLGEEI